MKELIILIGIILFSVLITITIINNLFKSKIDISIGDLIREIWANKVGYLRYLSTVGTISYDLSLKRYMGYIPNKYGSITYEAKSIRRLKKEFKEAVTAYLDYKNAVNQP